MYLDYTYVIYVLPAILLSLIAQAMVKGRFAKFNQVASKRGITGAQAAAILLRTNGINDVKIAHIRGNLTDNYNPSTKECEYIPPPNCTFEAYYNKICTFENKTDSDIIGELRKIIPLK